MTNCSGSEARGEMQQNSNCCSPKIEGKEAKIIESKDVKIESKDVKIESNQDVVQQSSNQVAVQAVTSTAAAAATAATAEADEAELSVMPSKTQMKKRSRKEAYLKLQEERKRYKKQKKENRKAERQKNGEKRGETTGLVETKEMVEDVANDVKGRSVENAGINRNCRKKQEFLNKCSQNATIVIDCQFEGMQTEKETRSLSQQLMYTYGANKKSENPFQLIICGIYGELQKRLEKISGYESWRCQKSEKSCDSMFGWKGGLTSDGQKVQTKSESSDALFGWKGGLISNGASTVDGQNVTKNESSGEMGIEGIGSNGETTSTGTSSSLSSSSLLCGNNSSEVPPSDGLAVTSRSVTRSSDGDSGQASSCDMEAATVEVQCEKPPTNNNSNRFIYLTADSDNILESVDSSCTYIVGGLVDRNRYPGVTAKRAQSWNICTARLPIQEHWKLEGSKVLTINQVIEILSQFVQLKNWKDAISAAIPVRKLKIRTSRNNTGCCDNSGAGSARKNNMTTI